MIEIVEWTTSEIEFALKDPEGHVPEGILENLKDASVIIKQGLVGIEKRLEDMGIDVGEGTMTIHLSQAETGRLDGGTRANPRTANIQVNLYYENGERDASYEAQVAVLRNLHDRAMA